MVSWLDGKVCRPFSKSLSLSLSLFYAIRFVSCVDPTQLEIQGCSSTHRLKGERHISEDKVWGSWHLFLAKWRQKRYTGASIHPNLDYLFFIVLLSVHCFFWLTYTFLLDITWWIQRRADSFRCVDALETTGWTNLFATCDKPNRKILLWLESFSENPPFHFNKSCST